ncbi:hypothetical protein FM107_12665 [Sphingobacterium sp. JB170]|nr:hypothetical protein FM107_12665 [Sphingobacterium sp. JB170]
MSIYNDQFSVLFFEFKKVAASREPTTTILRRDVLFLFRFNKNNIQI